MITHEDLSQIPVASSQMPASLLSKLSMVTAGGDGNMPGSRTSSQQSSVKGGEPAKALPAKRQPLIEEL